MERCAHVQVQLLHDGKERGRMYAGYALSSIISPNSGMTEIRAAGVIPALVAVLNTSRVRVHCSPWRIIRLATIVVHLLAAPIISSKAFYVVTCMLVQCCIYLHCSICVGLGHVRWHGALCLVLVADAAQQAGHQMQLQSCCVFV